MIWTRQNIGFYLALIYLSLIILLSIFSNQLLWYFGLNTVGDIEKLNFPPFLSSTYFFGANHQGQDLLALLISGAKYSIAISFFAALLAMTIGVLVGSAAGYFGDKEIQVKKFQLLALVFALPLPLYYFFLSLKMGYWVSSIIAIFLGLAFFSIIWFPSILFLKKYTKLNQPVSIPIDILNTKIAEIFFAIPSYFIILSFSSFLGDSMWTIVFVLGITSWPQTALLIRAELLKIRQKNYVDALKLAGLKNMRILFFHAIPNAINPVIVNFVFFISSLLIIESTLSYIGVSITANDYTWGKIIAGFRHSSANWWVAVFPGIIIFLTILSFHRIGHYLEDRLL